ncbi:MAG: tryptophan-rich sensory protein [Chitinophagales bacterium]|nr:tryptophan-rich sensory protein [Chitinophagales bacterium]HAE14743.1 TspO protein [Bacteroidota bacterium]MCB9031237.1 tryptophan-rich sensory protein [Chitinophagales bacterium]HPE98351.1 tryptophan-rich sensory protein [Chitinophagales bacterium]HPR30163.1 tryptophan-rich sensory protein [Chitinophagales bacterium]
MKLQLWKLVLSVLLCITIGAIGGFFTSGEIDTWYAALEKPPLNPPDWIFAPVWTTLYILMGISLALYWSAEYGNSKRTGFMVFLIQLGLNLLWSLLFFKLHSPLLALIDIVCLIGFILTNMYFFARVSRQSALLLLPYLAWVSFATYLNLSVLQLN